MYDLDKIIIKDVYALLQNSNDDESRKGKQMTEEHSQECARVQLCFFSLFSNVWLFYASSHSFLVFVFHVSLKMDPGFTGKTKLWIICQLTWMN